MAKDSILEVIDMLNEYSQDIQDGITNEAKVIAKRGQQQLRQTSPKRTGKFSRGWRVKSNSKRGTASEVIHQNYNAGLTYLLNQTHAKRGGGTVTPRSAGFIDRVDENVCREYERAVENIIKNGGSL